MKPETLNDRLTDALLSCGIEPTPVLLRHLRQVVSADRITAAQFKVLRLALGGMNDKEIGFTLGVHPRTVDAHWKALRERLGIASRFQLGASIAMNLTCGNTQ